MPAKEVQIIQHQLTRLALALALGAFLIFAILVINAYREQEARTVLYDYHLVSESSARALYAADSRVRHPLGLQEFKPAEITDMYAYVSNVLVEYEIMLKHSDTILTLDRQFANPQTAGVVRSLQQARDELVKLVTSAPESLSAAMLIAGNTLDIGLVSEQLFRLHRSAFLQGQREYDKQIEINSYILLSVLCIVFGMGTLFWVKTRRVIDNSLASEREALRASMLAEQSSVAKTDFLSRMSHELRTPLNSILGFGQLLKKDAEQPLSTRQEHHVDAILTAGSHLLELVNEVLDLDLIERGKLRLDLSPVSVAPELEACVEQLRPAITQNDLSIELDVPESHQVQADVFRLRQVLLNLLSNAIKYNRKGGQIHVWSGPASRQRLRIRVRDSGRGISTEEQQRLFTTFERVGLQSNSIEGTGIGLALSKQLVNIMRGEIGVESYPGKGSTFWFELPVAPIPPAQT